MDHSDSIGPTSRLGASKRKRISLSQGQLVRESFLSDGGTLPLVLEPVVEGLSLVDWVAHNRQHLEEELLRYGAILFRGFNVNAVDEFERFMKSMAGELLDYSYRSTPRTQVSGKIYTSTEYPAHQTIPLQNLD